MFGFEPVKAGLAILMAVDIEDPGIPEAAPVLMATLRSDCRRIPFYGFGVCGRTVEAVLDGWLLRERASRKNMPAKGGMAEQIEHAHDDTRMAAPKPRAMKLASRLQRAGRCCSQP